jgi:hypothetical protein
VDLNTYAHTAMLFSGSKSVLKTIPAPRAGHSGNMGNSVRSIRVLQKSGSVK